MSLDELSKELEKAKAEIVAIGSIINTETGEILANYIRVKMKKKCYEIIYKELPNTVETYKVIEAKEASCYPEQQT